VSENLSYLILRAISQPGLQIIRMIEIRFPTDFPLRPFEVGCPEPQHLTIANISGSAINPFVIPFNSFCLSAPCNCNRPDTYTYPPPSINSTRPLRYLNQYIFGGLWQCFTKHNPSAFSFFFVQLNYRDAKTGQQLSVLCITFFTFYRSVRAKLDTAQAFRQQKAAAKKLAVTNLASRRLG